MARHAADPQKPTAACTAERTTFALAHLAARLHATTMPCHPKATAATAMAAGCCCCSTTPVQELLLLPAALAFLTSGTFDLYLEPVVNTYGRRTGGMLQGCCWNAEQRANRSSIWTLNTEGSVSCADAQTIQIIQLTQSYSSGSVAAVSAQGMERCAISASLLSRSLKA
jgi:hypothetical protein